MIDDNQVAAEHATFRSFLNSYLREMDPGIPVFHRVDGHNVDCVELSLPSRNAILRVELTSRSLCGMHLFGRIWLRRPAGIKWRAMEPISAVHVLILASRSHSASATTHRHAELELLERIFQSYQATKRYLDHAAPQSHALGFIEAEQSLYFGHPLHPTPKSLQGMTTWQQAVYAPELRGSFQLTYFAVDKRLVRQDSAGRPVAAIIAEMVGLDAEATAANENEVLIPMHPLQAQALMLEPAVQSLLASSRLRHLGPAGPQFTATSSVRTLFCKDVAWMPKFSLPVRITNSQRLNRRHELDAGVIVARLFAKAGIDNFHPRLGFLHDSAYMTLEMPGRDESGFEVIFRENPFRSEASDTVVTVSALTAEPLPGRMSRLGSLIRDVARDRGLPLAATCHRWFVSYLDCVLDPLVKLYETHGVALEAHQQNSLLDISTGLPSKFYYRDSQGFYLSNRLRARYREMLPTAGDAQELFFDDREIRERFAYYLVVNQIFSVIARCGHDGLMSEADLLTILRGRLVRLSGELTGAGRDFAAGLLDRPSITAKANLAIRLKDVDELAAGGHTIYTHFPNPLSSIGLAMATESAHAIAS